MKQNQTFEQILNKTARRNCETLMEKARVANRVAKGIAGRGRRRSYEVKVSALNALITKFGSDVMIQTDHNTPTMVVVAIKNLDFGLHAPESSIIADR